ncbi:methyltransferase-like protein 22 isoform X1 [Hyaena hyaena]|uniref:methyltransferase-like protein 22 isoform X1 n=1 Tax=Hyaena hyaena TaxID=95912 RepID=UPI00192114E5|nr:methyltransferase-like protein 22 isoform X1 [Hyaena hyaena]XP_039100274.1 methyltransferase-like protein 22 isoform X1 [Hyaena hyaena]XP_039100275.1 methyltransferase-like protein 22 isoform X1 [Hyaena hyaena]XP_039100276.1 methyltransferase-like protein 22 isoform X1 [Hyaena hyaena]
MDEVTFKSDTVLSDVHLYTPNHRHLMVRLNGMGQPVFLSQFKLLWTRDAQTDSGAAGGGHSAVPAEEMPTPGPGSAGCPRGSGCGADGADTTSRAGPGAQLDEDGDLDVERRPRAVSDPEPAGPPRDKVHPMILTQEEEDTLADGAGEGRPQDIIRIVALSLLVSILSRAHHGHPPGRCRQAGVAGRPAPGRLHSVPTGPLPGKHRAGARGGHGAGQHRRSHSGADGLLYRCRCRPPGHVPAKYCPQRPPDCRWSRSWSSAQCPDHTALSATSQSLLGCWSPRTGTCLLSLGGVIKVKELDWLQDDLCTDPEVPFSWSQEDISDLYSHTTILLAAEVFYDDDLTDALFTTLSRLAHKLKNACTAILSVEKRLNFTLRHLEVTCEAYEHFRSWLQRLERREAGRLRFTVEPVEASFPQLLAYERTRQLELWRICVEPVT